MFSRTFSIRVSVPHTPSLYGIEGDTFALQFINMQIGTSQNVSDTFMSCNQPSFNSFSVLACNLCSEMREKIEVRKGFKKQERENEIRITSRSVMRNSSVLQNLNQTTALNRHHWGLHFKGMP